MCTLVSRAIARDKRNNINRAPVSSKLLAVHRLLKCVCVCHWIVRRSLKERKSTTSTYRNYIIKHKSVRYDVRFDHLSPRYAIFTKALQRSNQRYMRP